MRQILFFILFVCGMTLNITAREVQLQADKYGITPGAQQLEIRMQEILDAVRNENAKGNAVVIKFAKGTYDFHASAVRTLRPYFISNHDQDNGGKRVAIDLCDMNNVTIDGNGATFNFYGTIIPFAITNSQQVTLKNLHIDYPEAQIAQVEILSMSETEGCTFRPSDEVKWKLNDSGHFVYYGEGWEVRAFTGIAFEKHTHHIVYNTADLGINTVSSVKNSDGTVTSPSWRDKRLVPGTIVAMRDGRRPCPGVFIYRSKNITLNDVQIHFAEGMGVLANMSENITLKNTGVNIAEGSGRYFTTNADATHFSQCKGHIFSTGALYEGMMDDAINVHGIYLRVKPTEGATNTILCTYEHNQAYGFDWGDVGDKVQFINSDIMQNIEASERTITKIETIDSPIKTFRITLDRPIEIKGKVGIENLEWVPTVTFTHNTVRNNRARGALFSSPLKTICKNNVFDHVSGSAIVLCGDCNGWFESGAVGDLLIKDNVFDNCLTSYFQFTNAVISIYPEIPNLGGQTTAFHGGKLGRIRIEKNIFRTFDNPLLYAKSVDGLIFRKNRVQKNEEYKPFHWNKEEARLEKVENYINK